ncbi:hypothetical protein L6259_02635 [Candidatus Parcubacteria bacterium]|nr:hypothetical protein [Candidatus Parcubacteria bacterium]
MPNKQWDRNRLISATKEEKFNIIKYEIDMFDKTCEEIFNPEFRLKEWLEINLLIESFAIHTRGLIDFFFMEKNFVLLI